MIVIIGGGMVGLVMAAALARANLPVTVVESRQPILHWEPQSFDARVSAINLVSQRILSNLGIWPQLAASACAPLRGLQVWDHQAGGEIAFDGAEIGAAQLGFIVENRALIKALWEHLQTLPQVTLLCPRQPSQLIQDESGLQLQLDDQSRIAAELVIGADGAESWVRAQMQIPLQERSYEQQALIAVVKTEKPHQNIGWQSFLTTGPLGVLPLADAHQTAIVWSNTIEAAQRLLALSSVELNRELSLALDNRLGAMTALTELKMLPLIMRHATDYVQPRLALIGDAAHTIHPLAGQGVNLGLLDAAVLAQVIAEARQKHHDIGSLRVLRQYQRWRKGDNTLMLLAMRGFKELFGSASPWVAQLRSQGLNLTNHLGFIKNCIMHYASGQQSDLPDLAKYSN